MAYDVGEKQSENKCGKELYARFFSDFLRPYFPGRDFCGFARDESADEEEQRHPERDEQ